MTRLALSVVGVLLLTSCIGYGEVPDPVTRFEKVSVRLVPATEAGYFNTDQPIGLTIHFTESDQVKHGLPESLVVRRLFSFLV